MASSNPFRKKAVHVETRFPPIDPIDISQALSATPDLDDERLASMRGDTKRAKVIKRVRVLSPPPRSPDSPEWPVDAPPLTQNLPLAQAAYPQDPFNAALADESDRDSAATPPPPFPAVQPSKSSSHVPANPFSKTLEDLENNRERKDEPRAGEGAAERALKSATSTRKSLNVDSFRRLLMTGAAAPSDSPPSAEDSSLAISYAEPNDGASLFSVPAPSHDTRSSTLVAQTRDTASPPYNGDVNSGLKSNHSQRGHDKKTPPPPPSSRHGKSLRIGSSDPRSDFVSNSKDGASQPSSNLSQPSSPLPTDDVSGAEGYSYNNSNRSSISNHELLHYPASPQQNLEPQARSANQQEHSVHNTTTACPSDGKKSIPAPPPRRGHGRAESKSYASLNASRATPLPLPSKSQDDDPPSRSSMESNRSRSGSIRHSANAPVPPPPRRPYAAPKQVGTVPTAGSSSSSIPQAQSPSSQSSEADNKSALLDPPIAHEFRSTTPKLAAPPPPPPARHQSTRRPLSIRSIDAVSRRLSGEEKQRDGIVPPPPPPRQRGSSQSSLDGPFRRTSAEGGTKLKYTMSEPSKPAVDSSKSVDILADLDALKREIDVMRGSTS